MQPTTMTTALRKRGRLPALLAAGMFMLFILSACQVAVADDGSINIRPETTTISGGNTGNSNSGSAGNTLAGFLSQGVASTAALAPDFDPDKDYEWNGVIRWTDLEGGHFIIERDCDRWVVIPDNDEVYGRLKELNGEKATIWGTANRDPNIYGARAIKANMAFAPGEVLPIVPVPQFPCINEAPVPGDRIVIQHSEITLHGDLVWRGGQLWLVTDRGNVRLDLPAIEWGMFPELEAAKAQGDTATALSLGQYGAVGMWGLADTGLVLRVRDIEEWPHRTFVRDACGNGLNQFVVGDEQLAAYGTLVIDGDRWVLRTKSGVIIVHPNNSANGNALIDPQTGDALTTDALRTHEVVVIGDWKTDGRELHMEGDAFVRVRTECEPPQPPFQPILPGEVAALGKLVFENGRPYLDTPSGRIVLLTRRDVAGAEPEPADLSLFEGVIAGGVTDGGVVGEDGTVYPDAGMPDVVRPQRYILVVGKWLLYREHLAIVVRYARPWPYPQPQPVPMPEPMPVPPALGYPMPLPEAIPVEPVMPVEFDVIEPDFGGGFVSGFDGDTVPVEIDSIEVIPVPATSVRANAVSVLK